MSIAFVKNGGSSATGASATSASITVPAGGHAVGNTVYVAVAANSQPCTGVTDSKGNTYVKVSSSGDYESLWASILTVALVAGDTITAAAATATIWVNASAEFSGVTNVVDQATNKLNGSGAVTLTTTTTGTTTTPDELVIAAFLIGGTIGSFVATGFTSLTIPQNVITQAWCYKIVSATGTQDCTASIDQFHSYRAIAATFAAIGPVFITGTATGGGTTSGFLGAGVPNLSGTASGFGLANGNVSVPAKFTGTTAGGAGTTTGSLTTHPLEEALYPSHSIYPSSGTFPSGLPLVYTPGTLFTGAIEPTHITGCVEPAHTTGVLEPTYATGALEPVSITGIVESTHSTGVMEVALVAP